MTFLLLLLIVFFCAAFLCFFNDERHSAQWAGFLVFIGALVLLAAFRPEYMDQDYSNYIDYYNGDVDQVIEFTFNWFADLSRSLFDSPHFLFIIYAVLSVCLRGWGIVRTSNFWSLSIVVWMGNFYLYQDLTQIRVAVAAGIFLIALKPLAEGKKGTFMLWALLATCFHYSAFVLLFLAVLGNKPLGTLGRCIIAGVPILGYALYFVGFDPVVSLPIPWIQDKIEAYEYLRDSGIAGDSINVFNVVYLLRIAAFYIILWKYDVVKDEMPYLSLLLKIFAISIFCFAAFGALPVMSFRFAELLGSVEVVLFPCLALTVRPALVGRAVVVMFALGCLLMNVFYIKLFTFD